MPAVDARDADVVIVGAGVAGLTAAWRLVTAELRVVVLEARDRVGGRLHTVELEGEPFELGGQWIAPTQSAVRALLEELGLELFPRHRAGDSVRLMADGRVVRAGGDDLGLAPDGVAAYEAGVEQLRLLVAEVDPEAPWDHPDARRLDTMSYEQWLQAEVPHP
ncbi:MAG TPA: FAD-dependent oxidoreductase, partial [Solirubrobacteraceae bacterium]|nr:FAD-dependent oxidoreductase [Solirubrobacteraceae bacterium]